MCPYGTSANSLLRYSASTCDHNHFQNSGFTVPQRHNVPPRRTELFIMMTIYIDDEELFCHAVHGIIGHIVYLCRK